MKLKTALILITALALIVGAAHVVFRFNAAHSEGDAKVFATKMYRVKDPTASCTNMDSDGDGYISCTVTGVDGRGSLVERQLECARLFSFNSGCKPVRFTYQGNMPIAQ